MKIVYNKRYNENLVITVRCSKCDVYATFITYTPKEIPESKEELRAKIKKHLHNFNYVYCRKCGEKL